MQKDQHPHVMSERCECCIADYLWQDGNGAYLQYTVHIDWESVSLRSHLASTDEERDILIADLTSGSGI